MGRASLNGSTEVPAWNNPGIGLKTGRQYGNTTLVPSLYHCDPLALARFYLTEHAVISLRRGELHGAGI